MKLKLTEAAGRGLKRELQSGRLILGNDLALAGVPLIITLLKKELSTAVKMSKWILAIRLL